ncbi:DEAD/DEAH box helicase [Larkinella bovis]|uniref:DEAD/DEAH box helicase n=1 Tax=Larkinella bovis TaxID=683041 RepID=A0ABW0IC32_9BACT
MSYFEENYNNITLSVDKGTDETRGLRRAQLGAIHAIASHFTLRTDPALVVMPTGSGKTAVLMISAYLLQAKRVLVVTPSRLVRNDIALGFRELTVLKRLHVVSESIDGPKVHEQTDKISSLEDWDRLKPYDVVVASPSSISPAIEDIPSPPDDLFDLILVDEAHHSPARTWEELFNAFPNAKRILVTATPFRRDKREIKGKFVYVYPLREAYKDKIFGNIQFIPVSPEQENSDIAIAKKAEEIFNLDKAAGLHHALMVRTDSLRRANALKLIYAEHTSLNLRTIHSDHSYGFIKATIKLLREGNLDGVICVNMMGEGFDFPNLKIAAIHSPHKSLAVTLQFIGRFARTNAGNVDIAKFIAVPAEIEIESAKLYNQDAIWQEMIIDLSRSRIDEEVFVQESIQNFQTIEQNNPDTSDVSIYTLRPYVHVKVYKISGNVDFNRSINLPPDFEIINFWEDSEANAAIIIAKEVKRPKWSSSDKFLSSAYHLFIFYYDSESQLLFINSTLKQTELYEELARSFTDRTPKILPLNQINKVLLSLRDPSFYNVGMKNRMQSANAESYRNVTGPAAQKSITESDGQLYHRGHVFGGDEDSTIGFSSSSKIWSNARFLVPNLIRWCQDVASYLTSNSEVQTRSPLDYLNVGEDISTFPEGVIGAIWNQTVYKNPPIIQIIEDGIIREANLLDVNLEVDQSTSTQNNIRLIATCRTSARIELDYRLDADHWFNPIDPSQLNQLTIVRSHKNVSLSDYLNGNLPEFFFSDFSRLTGSELFPGPGGIAPSLNDGQLIVLDWIGKNVDITKEFGDCADGRISIHSCLAQELGLLSDIVFYDHGSGEIADFITFKLEQDEAIISFYHCKGSSANEPGERVKDYYEVCMQVIKSLKWIENNQRLFKQIQYRESNTAAHFIKGNLSELQDFLTDTRYLRTIFKLVVVQPGISTNDMESLSVLLAATGHYIAKSRGQHFEVWCS